jgi:hypothetical protein
MSFCEHCAGQRFDRAQVLRMLRATQRSLRRRGRAAQVDAALAEAIRAIRALEIPHIEYDDESSGEQVLH